MKLQIAMDMYDMDLYWKVLEQVHDVVDIVELGNIAGLGGSRLIGETREKYPDLCILWDAKATHYYPCMGVIDAKPAYLSMSSDADDFNYKMTIELAHAKGVKVIGDLLPGYDSPNQIHRLVDLGVDQISFHPNADPKKYPMGDVLLLDYVQAIAPKDMELAAYGGFTLENVHPVLERKPEIIVVGAAIWKAEDPRAEAIRWNELLRKYE